MLRSEDSFELLDIIVPRKHFDISPVHLKDRDIVMYKIKDIFNERCSFNSFCVRVHSFSQKEDEINVFNMGTPTVSMGVFAVLLVRHYQPGYIYMIRPITDTDKDYTVATEFVCFGNNKEVKGQIREIFLDLENVKLRNITNLIRSFGTRKESYLPGIINGYPTITYNSDQVISNFSLLYDIKYTYCDIPEDDNSLEETENLHEYEIYERYFLKNFDVSRYKEANKTVYNELRNELLTQDLKGYKDILSEGPEFLNKKGKFVINHNNLTYKELEDETPVPGNIVTSGLELSRKIKQGMINFSTMFDYYYKDKNEQDYTDYKKAFKKN